MSVAEAYIEDNIIAGEANPSMKHSPICELIGESVLYNCTATIETKDDGSKKTIGNVTEIGLINYLSNSNFDCESMLNSKKKIDPIFSIPFSSKRKR